MLKEIDRALEQRQFERALRLARYCYEQGTDYKEPDLLLLSITFSATIHWGLGHDLEEKKIADELWKKATQNMSGSFQIEVANHGIRLAEIYLDRREIDLAHSALNVVKNLITYGSLSLRYNLAVDSYVKLSGRVDTDLWIN